MARITITIPDGKKDRVLDAVSAEKGYDGTGTKAAFLKRWIIRELREVVVTHEVKTGTPNHGTVKADVDSIPMT
tara:strand:+ start:182 stop:403 length:222 start_codon:yes stop_codon:yes gene_type:complete